MEFDFLEDWGRIVPAFDLDLGNGGDHDPLFRDVTALYQFDPRRTTRDRHDTARTHKLLA
jgi:hypothetical protein